MKNLVIVVLGGIALICVGERIAQNSYMKGVRVTYEAMTKEKDEESK